MNSLKKSKAENSNTKKVKFHLIGRSGKMGQTVASVVSQRTDLELVEPPDADAFLDFSSPEGCLLGLSLALKYSKPFVSGTTGLSIEIQERLNSASKQIPLLHSPNFSRGISLLTSLAEFLRPFAHEIQIRETHHLNKKDSPSGTALLLKKTLGPVPIESIRVEDTVGIHEIFLKLPGEELCFTHKAFDRSVFAEGAIQSLLYLIGKPSGLYHFDTNLLKTKK